MEIIEQFLFRMRISKPHDLEVLRRIEEEEGISPKEMLKLLVKKGIVREKKRMEKESKSDFS